MVDPIIIPESLARVYRFLVSEEHDRVSLSRAESILGTEGNGCNDCRHEFDALQEGRKHTMTVLSNILNLRCKNHHSGSGIPLNWIDYANGKCGHCGAPIYIEGEEPNNPLPHWEIDVEKLLLTVDTGSGPKIEVGVTIDEAERLKQCKGV